MTTTIANLSKNINLLNPVLYVFILGAAIRFYNSWFTFYINSDGILYINQAKIIYYGRWALMPSSGLELLSNYPFFIAGAYALLQDWLLAARSVSFAFGALTLVPLYFLFKRFFDSGTSLLGTLLYAFIPVFVSRSADVLRDPVYWFFMVSGMYLFTLHGQPRYRLYLVLSNLSFLMATWARIEAFLLILVTAFYILVSVRERFKKLLFFSAPLLVIVALLFLVQLQTGISVDLINRIPEILGKLAAFLSQYKKLGADIEMMRLNLPIDNLALYGFMDKASNFAWLVALGTLVNHFLEGFFYPFCLVLIAGIPGSFEKYRQEPFLKYFVLIITLGSGLIYCHVVMFWNIDSRFLAIAMLPLFIYTGYGFANIKGYLKKKYKLTENTVMVALCLLVLLAGLPKNLYYREADKLVFKQIGEYVAQREEGNSAYIPVSSSASVRQLAYYSNLNNKELILPPLGTLGDYASNSYDELLRFLKHYRVKYFLWEEKFWSRQRFNMINEYHPDHFLELQHWYHSDTGNMILFKVTQNAEVWPK